MACATALALSGASPTASSQSPNTISIRPSLRFRLTSSDWARISVLSRTLPDSSTTWASNSPASSPRERSSVTFALPHRIPLSVTSTEGPVISPSTRPITTMGQVEVSVPFSSVPSSMRVFLVVSLILPIPPFTLSLSEDLHAQPAAALECKPGQLGVLLHRRHQRALAADDQLARPDDARALALEEVPVHGDRPSAGDPAVREHAGLAHHQLGSVAQVDGAVLEEAVDLDARARFEVQRRVLQHVALAEVAARGGRGLLDRRLNAGEQ